MMVSTRITGVIPAPKMRRSFVAEIRMKAIPAATIGDRSGH